MASQPPVIDESSAEVAETPAVSAKPAKIKTPRQPVSQVLRELNWPLLLIIGVGSGLLWTLLLVQGNTLQILAGLLPVTGGIIVGRRVKTHINWHAVLLGVITTLAAAAGILVFIATQGANEALIALVTVGLVTLLPFPAFGVITSARSEERRRALQAERERRGGGLDKPGRVRTIDDLRALSLPQLGGYVADLFRKHDFLVNDFRVEKEKDRIDFQMSYEGEPWLIRVTTAEKVKPGVPQELAQRMKAEGVKKGVVVTSMDFQEPATRWAKDKLVALIDGPTLLSMDD